MGFDKPALLARVVARLEADAQAIVAAQKATQAGSVHEESKQEDPKDTRAIESGYLARGLAERAEGLQLAVARLKSFRFRTREDDDPIALGDLVQLDTEQSGDCWYFVLPEGGGITLDLDEPQASARLIKVVTPRSPIGDALLGLEPDEDVLLTTPSGETEHEILAVL